MQKTNRGDKKPRKTHYVQAHGEETEDSYSLFTLQGGSEDAMRIQLTMNDIPISMEFDTGAAMSLINAATYHKIQVNLSMLSYCEGQVW